MSTGMDGDDVVRELTDLEPHLLIERRDLLRSVERRALLALRLQGKVAIDLWVGGNVTMVRGHASRG